MARTVLKLDEEEARYFHMNYAYMWKKLNTAPYYVSGSGEVPKWIRGQWLLPSYANLSKCLNPVFVPSMNIVNKIIQFYNANIQPEIDAYTFLHEKLENGDYSRTAASASDVRPYCGLYHGYYYAGAADRTEIYGAVLKIDSYHDTAVVQMITGIVNDEDLGSLALSDLFSAKSIPLEKYREYRAKLELSRRRTALFKGTAELKPGLLTLTLQSEDRAGNALVLRIPPVESDDGRYFGSLGLATLLTEHEMQILKIGIVRADQPDLKPFHLDDRRLPGILKIQKRPNEHICLSYHDNSAWNEMMLSPAE